MRIGDWSSDVCSSDLSVSVAGIFILAAFSEQQAAFEPGLELAIIGLKEDVILFGDRPADLGADRVGDLAHGAGVSAAPHAPQLLQLIDAIDTKLGVAEDVRRPPFLRPVVPLAPPRP